MMTMVHGSFGFPFPLLRLITVPYNLPMHKMRRKAIKRWARSGPLRAAYRRLVAGCVAPLPFVAHRYPEPEKQRRAAARLRHFAETKEFGKAIAAAMPGGTWGAGLDLHRPPLVPGRQLGWAPCRAPVQVTLDERLPGPKAGQLGRSCRKAMNMFLGHDRWEGSRFASSAAR